MYQRYKVRIPDLPTGISIKNIKGSDYIYYVVKSKYDPSKKRTSPQTRPIGKPCEDDPGMMYPNDNYMRFFGDLVELPERLDDSFRSYCLRVGPFFIIRKIVAEYHLDEILDELIGKESGLFLDLAAYSLLTENNAGQYYPDYAYNHPLFTDDMKIYSDSKVSSFLGQDMTDQRIKFLIEWNGRRKHKEKIYISYDSTNKNCQIGDVDFAEYGHPKDDQGKTIFNYSIAYDHDNRDPLFYEEYPGSINDVSQLQYMLNKAAGYGYKNVGFILDRGYFSESNLRYMDRNGFDFLIMMKGMKDLVSDLVLSHKGSFEEERKNSIRTYKVSGITVKGKLFDSDEKERYFHIYYSNRKNISEREKVETKIDRMKKYLHDIEGTPGRGDGFDKYFDLVYYHEGKPDETFVCAREKEDVINREIKLCGYFVIVSSQKMSAEEALNLYKSRDASEKLFRGDKSYLGNRSERTHSEESTETKIFIEFIALIIRNRIYTYLKDKMAEDEKKYNFMSVPAALKELEKIEMSRQPDGSYRLNFAVTKTQKLILGAFGMDEQNIKKQAMVLGNKLKELSEKEIQGIA
ncbi:IS1634 family transposase [Butyrivibrio sp. INlla14]|uniref:IS1634 family transposase n=1 Tax=Butyrivibrio sp. INlla14 TaxID=1520808 RepID=UPI000876290B|nr:transposase [Butyrivibrio sp. INlla14]SCY18507.1 Transposase DDE domain-containing protein [Butyrivibrio sp. INlla14]